jgi:hypothetical protein
MLTHMMYNMKYKNNEEKIMKINYRSYVPFVLSLIGSLFGIFFLGSIYISYSNDVVTTLDLRIMFGICAIGGSLLGLMSSSIIFKNPKYGSIGTFLGSILVLLAGVPVIFTTNYSLSVSAPVVISFVLLASSSLWGFVEKDQPIKPARNQKVIPEIENSKIVYSSEPNFIALGISIFVVLFSAILFSTVSSRRGSGTLIQDIAIFSILFVGIGGSLLGIIGTLLVEKNRKVGGLLILVMGILLLGAFGVSISSFSSSIFLLVGGVTLSFDGIWQLAAYKESKIHQTSQKHSADIV